jgi:hypothetical protein
MFRFSKDEYVASKQYEKSSELLEKLTQTITMEHSPIIEEVFDKRVRSYEILTELNKLSVQADYPIVMPAIPYDHTAPLAKRDFKIAFDKLNKPWNSTIPFIEFSFPEDYICNHGESFRHVYFFFFTPFHDFDEAEHCVLRYLNKLDRLKAFI